MTANWLISGLYNTVNENIIGATKMRNNYGAIKIFFFQYCDNNIGLFSIAPC